MSNISNTNVRICEEQLNSVFLGFRLFLFYCTLQESIMIIAVSCNPWNIQPVCTFLNDRHRDVFISSTINSTLPSQISFWNFTQPWQVDSSSGVLHWRRRSTPSDTHAALCRLKATSKGPRWKRQRLSDTKHQNTLCIFQFSYRSECHQIIRRPSLR